MSDLLEAINQHYHDHGKYPKVIVGLDFGVANLSELHKLIEDGIEVEPQSQPEDWRLE